MFIMFAMDVSWINNILRSLCAFFDWLVYSIITVFFRTIFHLANFELYDLYADFEERIYVILGIFMLFKLTISLLSYLVNPDKINDKEQGAGKVVVRVITVLVMLIGLNPFFDLLNEFQNQLLPALPRVILGSTVRADSDNVTGIANAMSVSMLSGFAYLQEGCEGTVFENTSDFLANINMVCGDTDETEDIYSYQYTPIISTICGVLSCYVLFSMCITVAIRAFKLIILRMIAPIPIISYIDPKSAKDGAFSHWTKTFINTWLELFINLGIMYFVIYLIGYLFRDGLSAILTAFSGIEGIDLALVIGFLVVGLLMFARQAPKFLCDALGIKSAGSFGRMLGMGAAALGGIGAARSAFRARQEYDEANKRGNHTLRNAFASLGSGLGAVSTGGNALLSDKAGMMAGYDAQMKSNAQMLSRLNAGSTLGGRLGAMGQMLLAGSTPADAMSRQAKIYEDANSALKDYKSAIESRFDGNSDFKFDLGNGHDINWMEFDSNLQAANNGDQQALKYFMDNGFITTVTEEVEVPEEYDVVVGTKNVWDADAGEYVPVDVTERRTRMTKQTVTKQVADMNTVRAQYDDIHKTGYSKFADAITGGAYDDSVVYGKLKDAQDKLKGVTVDVYEKSGRKDPGNATVDLTGFTGKYGETKGAMGNVSGTYRDYTQNPEYKAAMSDAKKS